MVTILILIDGFLQYVCKYKLLLDCCCHNPYFNRWFSAIFIRFNSNGDVLDVTILILIDGFLQYENIVNVNGFLSQSLF